MLLRISLILAILAGIGTIVVTQKLAREHVQEIINQRETHIKAENEERSGRKKAEGDLAKTRSTLATTSNSLVRTEEELTGTKQSLTTTQDQLNKTKGELGKAIEARKAMEAELAKWESIGMKPEQIRDLIANYKKQGDAIAALEDEKKILGRQVAELDNRIKILLGPPDDENIVQLPSGTKGNVVAVDPKWNFVVLDIGKDKAMLEGGVLLVHRNSQLVGKVRIREVQNSRSIATVMPGWGLASIEEGDQVMSKN